jgi:hypothetical protein
MRGALKLLDPKRIILEQTDHSSPFAESRIRRSPGCT